MYQWQNVLSELDLRIIKNKKGFILITYMLMVFLHQWCNEIDQNTNQALVWWGVKLIFVISKHLQCNYYNNSPGKVLCLSGLRQMKWLFPFSSNYNKKNWHKKLLPRVCILLCYIVSLDLAQSILHEQKVCKSFNQKLYYIDLSLVSYKIKVKCKGSFFSILK